MVLYPGTPFIHCFVHEGGNRSPEQYPNSFDEYWLWGHKGAHNVRSDWLERDDAKAFMHACVAIVGKPLSQFDKEAANCFLSAYFKKPLDVVGLSQACHVSNGTTYWVFWFNEGVKP